VFEENLERINGNGSVPTYFSTGWESIRVTCMIKEELGKLYAIPRPFVALATTGNPQPGILKSNRSIPY
jgi:hypothetical protein